MSDFVNAVVKGEHQVHYFDAAETDKDKAKIEKVATKDSGVIKLSKSQFEELEALGAVRKAEAEDKSPKPAEPVAALVPGAQTKVETK